MEFKLMKNDITNITRQSKKEYYDQYFRSNARNLKKTWRGIKDIFNIKNKNHNQPTSIIEGNRTITDSKEIAKNFSNYYISIASKI